MKNAKFYKRDTKGMLCFFDCGNKAEGILVFLDKSECPRCKNCSGSHIYTLRAKSSKIPANSHKEMQETLSSEQGTEAQDGES